MPHNPTLLLNTTEPPISNKQDETVLNGQGVKTSYAVAVFACFALSRMPNTTVRTKAVANAITMPTM